MRAIHCAGEIARFSSHRQSSEPKTGGRTRSAVDLARSAAPRQRPSPAHNVHVRRSCCNPRKVSQTQALTSIAASASLVTY